MPVSDSFTRLASGPCFASFPKAGPAQESQLGVPLTWMRSDHAALRWKAYPISANHAIFEVQRVVSGTFQRKNTPLSIQEAKNPANTELSALRLRDDAAMDGQNPRNLLDKKEKNGLGLD